MKNKLFEDERRVMVIDGISEKVLGCLNLN